MEAWRRSEQPSVRASIAGIEALNALCFVPVVIFLAQAKDRPLNRLVVKGAGEGFDQKAADSFHVIPPARQTARAAPSRSCVV